MKKIRKRFNNEISIMKKKAYRLLLVFSVFNLMIQASVNHYNDYNIVDFGAVDNPEINSTAAIQKAIDECSKSGGGKVIVPKGSYLIGTIFLKQNVNLFLAPEAELLGSTDLSDYSDEVHNPVEAPRFKKCLIYAENENNISITGYGTINGRGSEENFDHWGERPMMIRFYQCKNILLQNIKLTSSASWNTHLMHCDKVKITGIYIHNRMQGNNDGIDMDGCKQVFISNCIFDTEDDPICGKSTTMDPLEDVVITNCIIRSTCSGFKLGTSSKGVYRNISISNCIMKDTYRGTIKIICVDGGIIENVNISDIVMDNVEGPVFIRLGDRGKIYEEAKDQDYSVEGVDAIEGTPVGVIRDISISNIRAHVTGKDTAQAGIMITGVPGHYIENISLSNIHIIYPGGGARELANRKVAEDEKRYPEQSFFGELPSYAMFVRHAKDIIFDNIKITYKEKEERPAFVLDDAINVEFNNIRVMKPASDSPLFVEENTRNIIKDKIRE